MTDTQFINKIKNMIDDLKALTSSLGLSNTGDEYKIISELFTYKFLNDKLVYEFENRENKNETFAEFVEFADENTPKITEEYLIDNLFSKQNKDNFRNYFNDAFVNVNALNADIYNIETTSGSRKNLFEPLSVYIRDEAKESILAIKAINILANDDYNFNSIFSRKQDFFSSIFEYLIKDYNKDSGQYAEYFTPLFAGDIMSQILFNMQQKSDSSNNDKQFKIYDPSAGSGTLLLSLAQKLGVSNCEIFSQDISQKSTQFLRINLILNELVHSLHNVVEGNTLTNPSHLVNDKVMTFDFVVSNPPFKTDFSDSVETLNHDKYNRFFAGIPGVPPKKKDSMAIYEVFLQHFYNSINDSGYGAIVVPTGFVSASQGIAKKIRKEFVERNIIDTVIHMPSSIFANTNTSVSIIFVNKSKINNKIYLMDASNLGQKIKLDDGQRTILSSAEEKKIVEYATHRTSENEFSKEVDQCAIKENDYMLQAGNYYDLNKIEYNGDFKKDIDKKLNNIKSISNDFKSDLDDLICLMGEFKNE